MWLKSNALKGQVLKISLKDYIKINFVSKFWDNFFFFFVIKSCVTKVFFSAEKMLKKFIETAFVSFCVNCREKTEFKFLQNHSTCRKNTP